MGTKFEFICLLKKPVFQFRLRLTIKGIEIVLESRVYF